MKIEQTDSVDSYLSTLPEDRRETISRIRDLVNGSLPEGYQEAINWGMICWEVPLERYPDTYNNKPLMYLSLAAQKRHNALYMMAVYSDNSLKERLESAFAEEGKKADMGKSCIRFKSVEDLPIDVIAELINEVSVERYIEIYESSRSK